MRVTLVVSSAKQTGAAAVAELHCRALRAVGVGAHLLFVAGNNLERRLVHESWALSDLVKERGLSDFWRNLRVLRSTAEQSDVIVSHLSHDHFLCVMAGVSKYCRLVRSIRHSRQLRRDPLHRWLARTTSGLWIAHGELVGDLVGRLATVPRVVAAVPVEGRFAPGGNGCEWRQRFGVPADRSVIGAVGKLAQGRGFDLVLRAMVGLPDAMLVIVGVGEARPGLEALAHDLGIEGRVFWAGYQDVELPGLYAAMNLLVFAAAGSDHGHRVLVEAQACGCPVLAVGLPGVLGLIADERTGVVCGGSAAELAEAAGGLLAAPNRAAGLAAAAVEVGRGRRLEPVGVELARFLEGIG